MGKLIAAASVLFLLNVGSACKKDKEKKAEPTPEPTAEPAKPEVPEVPVAPKAFDPANREPVTVAEAIIASASDSKVTGKVTFKQRRSNLKISATFTGLTAGEHGFHIHETGDCSAPDAKSAGGHFNPKGGEHGYVRAHHFHAGDLGNIKAGEDVTGSKDNMSMSATILSLEEGAENSIIGRAVVIHAGADDMKTQPSGNAGARVGCGVIKMAE